MQISEDQYKYGKNFREVVDLRLIIIHSRCISMVFDNVYNQPGHRIERLECVVKVSRLDAFDVAVDTRFGAYSEEKRGDILDFQDALFRKLGDKRNKVLFR